MSPARPRHLPVPEVGEIPLELHLVMMKLVVGQRVPLQLTGIVRRPAREARLGRLTALGLAWSLLGSPPATAAEEPEDFSFVVLGHFRTSSDETVHPLLEEIVDEIERLDPDLVFLSGDAIWGGLEHEDTDPERIERAWDNVDEALGRLRVPIHRVPGNHDINDPVTRDIFYSRYGRPPLAVDHGGSRFLLLRSFHVPEDEWPAGPRWVTGLGQEQVDFIRSEVAAGEEYEHVFLLLHHLLWWDPDAPWWTEVHPYLEGTNVSAVFSGDLHLLKYSYMRRDGIDYVHAAMGQHVHSARVLSLLREHGETFRMLAFQLDPLLHVTVRGPQVTVDVVTVGEMTSGSLTPRCWEAVYAPDPPPTLRERISAALGSTRRRVALAGGLLGSLLVGVMFGRFWARRGVRRHRLG